MSSTTALQTKAFANKQAYKWLGMIACTIAFIASAHAQNETLPDKGAPPWWPDTEVINPSAEKFWEERKQIFAKKGKNSAGIQWRLDQAKLLKKFPEKEQKALLALNQHQSFPWIRIGEDKQGQPTVIAIDLSGRSNRIDGPELQARFAVPVGNETIPLLADLPNLVALYAFDTKIDDAGVAQIALLPKLQAVWLPPLATDEDLRSLAKAKEIEWLCWVGCDDIHGLGLDAWKGHAKLRTIRSWHMKDLDKVAELAKRLPALVNFWYGDRNLGTASASAQAKLLSTALANAAFFSPAPTTLVPPKFPEKVPSDGRPDKAQ